jgi:hypothetical protein
MGLPLTPPPPLSLKTNGDFFSKPHLHRITLSTALSSVQFLMLYPRSFPAFIPSEPISAPPLTSLTSPQCHTILHPAQAAVYASILRIMLAYPRYCSTWRVLNSDLSELIGYNLYDLQIGYVDIDDEELCQELEVDWRVDVDALQTVKGDGKRRDGEEWMGDALAAVVKGWGEIDYLPWAPPPMLS